MIIKTSACQATITKIISIAFNYFCEMFDRWYGIQMYFQWNFLALLNEIVQYWWLLHSSVTLDVLIEDQLLWIKQLIFTSVWRHLWVLLNLCLFRTLIAASWPVGIMEISLIQILISYGLTFSCAVHNPNIDIFFSLVGPKNIILLS